MCNNTPNIPGKTLRRALFFLAIMSLTAIHVCSAVQNFSPARRDILIGYAPIEAEFLDLERDGTIDLLVLQGGDAGEILFLRGSGNGEFEIGWKGDCGVLPKDVCVTDIDRDEIPDVVVSLSGEGGIRTFYGMTSGQFTEGEYLEAGHGVE